MVMPHLDAQLAADEALLDLLNTRTEPPAGPKGITLRRDPDRPGARPGTHWTLTVPHAQGSGASTKLYAPNLKEAVKRADTVLAGYHLNVTWQPVRNGVVDGVDLDGEEAEVLQ